MHVSDMFSPKSFHFSICKISKYMLVCTVVIQSISFPYFLILKKFFLVINFSVSAYVCGLRQPRSTHAPIPLIDSRDQARVTM